MIIKDHINKMEIEFEFNPKPEQSSGGWGFGALKKMVTGSKKAEEKK